MIGRPPRDVKPEQLFRSVLRGEADLSTRINGVALRVRAPSVSEAAELIGLFSEEWIDGHLIAATVWARGRRAFASAREAGLLTPEESTALAAEVWRTLRIVAPTYAGSDVSVWEDRLRAGAQRRENWAIMTHLGRCGGPESARPDIWFGRPVSELSDGQLMISNVCRQIYIKQVNDVRRRR